MFRLYSRQLLPTFSRQRPYHIEYTSSRPITEVKQCWARLVLGWETAWEHWVLLALLTSLKEIICKSEVNYCSTTKYLVGLKNLCFYLSVFKRYFSFNYFNILLIYQAAHAPHLFATTIHSILKVSILVHLLIVLGNLGLVGPGQYVTRC